MPKPKEAPVHQVDILTGDVIETFASCEEASRRLQLPKQGSRIRGCANGKCHSVKGYKFR